MPLLSHELNDFLALRGPSWRSGGHAISEGRRRWGWSVAEGVPHADREGQRHLFRA